MRSRSKIRTVRVLSLARCDVASKATVTTVVALCWHTPNGLLSNSEEPKASNKSISCYWRGRNKREEIYNLISVLASIAKTAAASEPEKKKHLPSASKIASRCWIKLRHPFACRLHGASCCRPAKENGQSSAQEGPLKLRSRPKFDSREHCYPNKLEWRRML